MIILYEKRDWGSGRHTWRINHGVLTRNKTALRKVTNRQLKRKLWFRGNAIKAY